MRTMFFTFKVGTLSFLTYRLTELYKNKLQHRMHMYVHDWGVRVGPPLNSDEVEQDAESSISDSDAPNDPQILDQPVGEAEPHSSDDLASAIQRVRAQVEEYLLTLQSPCGSDDEQIEARIQCLSKLRSLYRDVQATFEPEVQDVVLGYIRDALRGRTFGLMPDL